MNADDLDKTIEAILLRNDGQMVYAVRRVSWSCSAVRQRREDCRSSQTSCEINFSSYRGARSYVASSLPAIHLERLQASDRWRLFFEILGWAGRKSRLVGCGSKATRAQRGLVSVVDEMRASLQRF